MNEPEENREIEKKKFLRFDPEKRRKIFKRTRAALYILALLIVLALFMGGDSGLIKLIGYKRYEKTLQNQLALEELRNDSLQQVLHSLKSDSTYLERMIREKSKMVKDDERIYLFHSQEKGKNE